MKKFSIFLIVLASFILPSVGSAYFLNTSNETSLGTHNFASVLINVTGTTASFTVDADPDGYLFSLGPGSGAYLPNFGIQNFYFNTNLSLAATDFTLQSGWSVGFNQNAGGGFGTFDVEYVGGGGSRLDPLTFSITNAAISSVDQFYIANSVGYHFAAHIADFYSPEGENFTSAKFADGPIPFPEPGMMLVLGGLLFGLGVVNRKRMVK